MVRPGIVVAITAGRKEQFVVFGGLAEVSADRLIVLADDAMPIDEFDRAALIESISEMVNHLNRAQKEQTKGSEAVLSAMENIKRVADAQHTTMRELEQAIEQLASQSETLRSELRRFRV